MSMTCPKGKGFPQGLVENVCSAGWLSPESQTCGLGAPEGRVHWIYRQARIEHYSV